MSTTSNRRAMCSSTPRVSTRGGQDQPNANQAASPRGASRSAQSPDETNAVTAPIARPSRRSSPQQPIVDPPPTGRSAAASTVVPQPQAQNAADNQKSRGLLLWDPILQTLADGLDDIEQTRIAQHNRYRILTTSDPDGDGETRGFGLPDDHPAVAALAAQLQTLDFLDKQMTKALEKQLRTHPLHPWVKRQKGLGDKTIARLLAAVRDPYWNDLHNRPRTIGELFAFCGVAGPGQRKQKGHKVNWNPDARKRLWIITGPIIRGNGPYRAIYDQGREKYADKTHTTSCAQCGKKGQPAQPGTPWRDGHKHAGAIRLVMREILRDLWTEARVIYETQDGLRRSA